MEKGSADEFQSLAREASSPTFLLCDQEEHLQVPSSHEMSMTGREVADRDVVKSTSHLLDPDAGFLGGAEQGNAEATKDVTDNTFHPDASWRWGARRRHKPRSLSSNASRHLHRNRGKEGQSAKAVEYKETPTTTTAVSTLGHPRARHNSAIPRYEATRPETSDTIEKAAALSPDSGSPHGGSTSHTARQPTPELCSALASRSRNHPKRRSTSTSTLKKRARPKKAEISPPLLDDVTPPLGHFDDDNPAVLDECATSACQNLMTPLSTAGKGVWSTYALDQTSQAPGELSPALGATLPNAQPSVADVHLASPTSGKMSPELFSATVPSPFVPGSVCSSPRGIVAPQAAPTQPAPAFPCPSTLPRRVPYPSESHASLPLITRDTSLPSVVPPKQGQLSDALVPIASEGSRVAGPPQPLLGETSPVIDSKVPSPAANLSGAESVILPQGNKLNHLKSRSQTETVQSRRKTTSVRFGATTLWEITVASASRLTGSPVACGICCVILTATLVSVALVFLTNRTRPTYIKECTSAVCARATSSLWALMEDTVDPCQDFYSHVCRRWDNITGGRLKYLDHSVQQIARRVNQSLHDADELGGASHATRGVAQFYKLCLRFVTASDRAISRTQILRLFRRRKSRSLADAD
ncbi:hypothetical protein HPB50_019942 [Hyalomma asiaticum]|uniref:Uncharacterized protein n=1 Tax=Hyalomma asiaticum TaxID=266040 RepID=A0ACB7SWK1_HYAAI|nr:hypothetical protein HPB50_019942 [Hyalomma asiaticum]